MSIERARQYFSRFQMENRMMEFDTSSATVELAAKAVGCEPARIAKTLSFKVDDRAVLIVTAGDAKIDNPKYKAQFHVKAKCLPPRRWRIWWDMRWEGFAPLGSRRMWMCIWMFP